MQHVYDAAHAYLGLKEYPGAEHNPQVIKDFATVGHGWVQDDETPWCAAFVGARLAECGMKGTGKLNARSYETWGEGVAFEDVQKGDVCVFWRKNKAGPYGHVAFFDSYDEESNTIRVLGGNQGNAVSVAKYPYARLIALRRATPEKRERASMAQSKTLQASTVAKVAAAASPVVAAVGGMPWQNLAILGALSVVILFATGVIDIERIKKWKAGDR